MKRTTIERKHNSIMARISLLFAMFMSKDIPEDMAYRRAVHQASSAADPMFMQKGGYRRQQRAKQKRKNIQLHPAGARR